MKIEVPVMMLSKPWRREDTMNELADVFADLEDPRAG